MNGRVYDPSIARFLSPDVQVPFPEHTQSYNRYSYVRNNPLSWVDPSGYGGKSPHKSVSDDGWDVVAIVCQNGGDPDNGCRIDSEPPPPPEPEGCKGQNFCTYFTGDAVQDYGRSLTNAVGNFIVDEVQGYVQEVRSFFQENHIGLTIGVNATLGGHPLILLPGPFVGGGMSVTITTDGQVMVTFSGNLQGGVGAFGGVGLQAGITYSDRVAPTYSTELAGHAEANFGAGVYVGAQTDIGSSGASAFKGIRGGAGFGLNASVGVQRNTTLAFPALINW